jgi:hypothetical protein
MERQRLIKDANDVMLKAFRTSKAAFMSMNGS